MRFDRPITYNGWTASLARTSGGYPASGYLVESVEPSRVGAVGYLDKRALQDGLDANDVYLSGRDFGMVVSVFGSTWGDFWDKAQDLLAAFSPTLAYAADSANVGFLAFDFIQPTADTTTWPTATYAYGIPMRYYLRPSAPPEYTLKRDEVGGDATVGIAKQFRINLLARDPRKYAQTGQSLTITTPVKSAEHRGDYPTLPVVTFALSATGHSAFTLNMGAQSLVINLSTVSSGTYTYSQSDKTLLDANGASQASLITSGTLASIQPGGVTTYNRANDTGISSATLTYREAWA